MLTPEEQVLYEKHSPAIEAHACAQQLVERLTVSGNKDALKMATELRNMIEPEWDTIMLMVRLEGKRLKS